MQFKYFAIPLVMVMTGCGSGGSTTANSSTTPISGVAAVGAPLSEATVVLIDASNNSMSVKADAEGSYTFTDVSNMTAPFLLKATGTVGGEQQTMYSALDEKPAAGQATVLNVTPMTHSVVAQLSNGDPAKIFSDPTSLATYIKPTDMKLAKEKIVAVLEDQLKEQGLDSTKFDPFKTPFKANSSGFDKMLDLVKMQADASGNMTVIDKSTGIEKSISKIENVAAMAAKKMPPPPTGMKDLDFSLVKDLINGINKAIAEKTSPLVFFDSSFLMDGQNAAQFSSEVSGSNGVSNLASFVFGPCDVAKKVCDGNVSANKADGSFFQAPMPVKFDTAAKAWKFFGNQRQFKADFNQEVQITAVVNASNTATLTQTEGFRLWIDKSKGAKAVLSVGIKPNIDTPPSNWTSIATFDKNYPTVGGQTPNCQNLRLSSQNDDPCNHFIKFESIGSTLNNAKEAYQAGLLRFKISVFTNSNDTTAANESDFRPSFKIFDDSEKEKLQALLKSNFKLNELNSSKISMPKGLSVYNLGVKTGNTFVSLDARMPTLAKLGDEITVEEICVTAAAMKLQVDNACTNSKINSVEWSIKDPGGSGVAIIFKYSSSST